MTTLVIGYPTTVLFRLRKLASNGEFVCKVECMNESMSDGVNEGVNE